MLETEPPHGHSALMQMRGCVVSFGRLALACIALTLGRAPAARAQASTRSAWGLFSARYDTHTSDFIYALYGYGHSFAMVGTLQNPRSGWTELVGAIGRSVAIGGQPGQSIAAGVAHASDGWYGQLYFVPAFRLGPTWLRATAEWDVPLSTGGVTQFALSPASLTIPVARAIQAGVSMDLASAQRARTSVAIGPELRVAIPGAVVGTDLQRMTDGSTSRLRFFFVTQF